MVLPPVPVPATLSVGRPLLLVHVLLHLLGHLLVQHHTTVRTPDPGLPLSINRRNSCQLPVPRSQFQVPAQFSGGDAATDLRWEKVETAALIVENHIVLHRQWEKVVLLIVEKHIHILLHQWKGVVVLIGDGDGEEGGRQLNCVADQLIFSSLNLF